MTIPFVNSFKSEWLKKRHTASSWIVLTGAFFMPLIVLFMRLKDHDITYKENQLKHVWIVMYNRNWTAMAMFLLPMMLILSTSLITNIEFKNNTWKQLHTTPQKFSVIYFAKLSVILVMLLQLFALFNVGIYLSVVIPSFVYRDIALPQERYPFWPYMRGSIFFFIDSLPVIAVQYLLSLKFKNFIVPVGVGFCMLVVALLALNWRYGYVIPYIYLPLNFKENQTFVDPNMNMHYWAAGYFLISIVLGYVFYISKKEKS